LIACRQAQGFVAKWNGVLRIVECCCLSLPRVAVRRSRRAIDPAEVLRAE
jgi:hypothetical protein